MSPFGFYLLLMFLNALLAMYVGWRSWTEEKFIPVKDVISFFAIVLVAMFVPFVDLICCLLGFTFVINEAWENDDKGFWLNKNIKKVTSFIRV